MQPRRRRETAPLAGTRAVEFNWPLLEPDDLQAGVLNVTQMPTELAILRSGRTNRQSAVRSCASVFSASLSYSSAMSSSDR